MRWEKYWRRVEGLYRVEVQMLSPGTYHARIMAVNKLTRARNLVSPVNASLQCIRFMDDHIDDISLADRIAGLAGSLVLLPPSRTMTR